MEITSPTLSIKELFNLTNSSNNTMKSKWSDYTVAQNNYFKASTDLKKKIKLHFQNALGNNPIALSIMEDKSLWLYSDEPEEESFIDMLIDAIFQILFGRNKEVTIAFVTKAIDIVHNGDFAKAIDTLDLDVDISLTQCPNLNCDLVVKKK